MPESVSFVITTYRKLAPDERGATQEGTRRCSLGEALEWLVRELPEDAIHVFYLDEEGNSLAEWVDDSSPVSDHVRMEIDWAKVPEYIREPKLPRPRGR